MGKFARLQQQGTWNAGTIALVGFNLWDGLGRCVAPIEAVFAPAVAALTVTTGTHCNSNGGTCTLEAKPLLPGNEVAF